MRKRSVLIFTLFVLFLTPLSVKATPVISASSACVLDAKTGRILYEKNAYEERGMASTTKIMTAIVALEKGNLEEVITVSENAANTEGSSIWIESGEQLTLKDLLYGLLLASGNDAAVAIAEGVGGDVDTFVSMMNEKAKEIGAYHTSFENPNGLTADNHYTTAYDLALITRYAMQNETFCEIVGTKTKTIPWENSQWDRTLTNHNKLLTMYEGCTGVKTGYTKACGRCLVSSATRNGVQLICVTLNDPNDWEDHKNMLNFAFENFPPTTVIAKGMEVEKIPILESEYFVSAVTENEVLLPLSAEEKERITFEIQKEELYLPVKAGDKVGTLKMLLGESEIAQVDLISATNYEKPPEENLFWGVFNLLLKLFLQGK